jgi:hypothetical protein
LVNAWGFRHIKNGRDVNAYYREVRHLLVYCEPLTPSGNRRTVIRRNV